jgi:ubiquinone/menaquinone biosynthesis C-methylase UbiE
VGVPWSGQIVVDLGCGATFDALLAAGRVGPTGMVFGVDVTPQMILKARTNAALAGLANVALILGEVERVGLRNESADLVISNGVINLCPNKPRVLSEAYRLLRPGGQLQMADVLLEPQVTPEEAAAKGTWSE